jgi:hypothetical protein
MRDGYLMTSAPRGPATGDLALHANDRQLALAEILGHMITGQGYRATWLEGIRSHTEPALSTPHTRSERKG